MCKGSWFAREEPLRLQGSQGLKAALVPGMREGGVSPAGCSWRQGRGGRVRGLVAQLRPWHFISGAMGNC